MEKNKNHICLYPFYGFYYRGDDHKIGACCVQKPMLSYIPDTDIKDWWTGEDIQKMRQQFLDGEWPETCTICKKQSEAGVKTHRYKGNELLSKIGASFDDLDVIKGNSTGEPIFIDYKPDNLCNLSCTMCYPGASSKIEKMARDLDLDYWKLPDESAFEENDKIKKIMSPATKRLKVLGGEPTINEKVKEIYQYAIDKDYAKDMFLVFTSNFTNYNKTFDTLEQFARASVTASLDGTGPTYEYIRTPARWNTVKQNILKYKELKDSDPTKYFFNITSVWFTATAFTLEDWLPELLNFLDENFPKSPLTINQCQTPHFQNLSVIPPEYRQEIYDTIEDLRSKHLKWKYVFDNLKFGLDWFQFDPKNLKMWQEYTLKMDAYKKTDITTLHPRYKDLLNYKLIDIKNV